MVQTAQNTCEVQQTHYIDRIEDVSYDATPRVNHPDSSEATTRRSHRCSTVPEVSDILVPQIEEEQTVVVVKMIPDSERTVDF